MEKISPHTCLMSLQNQQYSVKPVSQKEKEHLDIMNFALKIKNDHKITIVGGSRTIELQAQAEEGEGEEQEQGGGEQGGGEQGGEQGGEGEEQQGEQQGEQGGGKKCNDSLKLNNGDKTLQIVKGNYSIELDEGNITIKCQEGNVEFNITGDVTYTCTGSFDVSAN